MKTFIVAAASLAMLAGVTISHAQTSSTPGAGSPGQDQRPSDQESKQKTSGQPMAKDAPTGSGAMNSNSKMKSKTTGTAPSGKNQPPSEGKGASGGMK